MTRRGFLRVVGWFGAALAATGSAVGVPAPAVGAVAAQPAAAAPPLVGPTIIAGAGGTSCLIV